MGGQRTRDKKDGVHTSSIIEIDYDDYYGRNIYALPVIGSDKTLMYEGTIMDTHVSHMFASGYAMSEFEKATVNSIIEFERAMSDAFTNEIAHIDLKDLDETYFRLRYKGQQNKGYAYYGETYLNGLYGEGTHLIGEVDEARTIIELNTHGIRSLFGLLSLYTKANVIMDVFDPHALPCEKDENLHTIANVDVSHIFDKLISELNELTHACGLGSSAYSNLGYADKTAVVTALDVLETNVKHAIIKEVMAAHNTDGNIEIDRICVNVIKNDEDTLLITSRSVLIEW